jgi:hypothetical protein
MMIRLPAMAAATINTPAQVLKVLYVSENQLPFSKNDRLLFPDLFESVIPEDLSTHPGPKRISDIFFRQFCSFFQNKNLDSPESEILCDTFPPVI